MITNQRAELALATLQHQPVKGIPIGLIHVMEHAVIEHLAGARPGSYRLDPYKTYIDMLERVGVCMVDQMLMENPLSMGDHGYEADSDTSLASSGPIVRDGIVIDSPEACVDHMERFLFPQIQADIRNFRHEAHVQTVINAESRDQQLLGPNILKTGHGVLTFPCLLYTHYGYESFFMAYALYPEVMEHLFSLQADLAVLRNKAVVAAYQKAGRPLYHRLDHDMADSRGLLVSLASLEKLWLQHFCRSIAPAVAAGFKLLWHCDGNLMAMIPALLACGVNGFQGFQYEDGMDYVKICRMKAKSGDPLVIQAGVSVTRELPLGTPADVKRQIDFLVANGPPTGLFLSFSSSCAPGTPLINIETAVAGMQYYQQYGRS
ncbi:MAG: hypothetical protein SCM11_08940 [Bacillota bacterium]|nr:hypothetical protein [Bacillota bacterium]